MFEIYKSEGKRSKSYIVTADRRRSINDLISYAKRYFRCSETHIEIVNGWILENELYLENPHKRGAVERLTAFYKR